MMDIQLNGHTTNYLFDSGSTESFVHPDTVRHYSLPMSQRFTLVSKSHTAKVCGFCVVTLTVRDTEYSDFKLLVLPLLCAAMLLGLDFQCHLNSLRLQFNGPLPPLTVCSQQFPNCTPRPTCSLSTLKVPPPLLFANLTPDCKPVATKSRRYSTGDRNFILYRVNLFVACVVFVRLILPC